MTKIKDKERILKAARGKQQITHKGIPIRLATNFSADFLLARREWHDTFKIIKGKPTTKNNLLSQPLIQILWRTQKLYRQAKAKRTQHHQTSFTYNKELV